MLSTILKGLDLWAALLLGVASFTVGMNPELVPFDLSGDLALWPVAGLLLTLALAVFGLQRWLTGHVNSSDYGQIVRTVDSDGDALTLPYLVVVFVALAGSVFAVLTTLLAPVVDTQWVRSLLYSSVIFFGSWTLFGLVGVLMISWRHDRRRMQVESLRERFEAGQREEKANGTDG